MGLLPLVFAAAVVTGPITGGDRGQPFSAMPAADLSETSASCSGERSRSTRARSRRSTRRTTRS
jgi:hypothetical protein